jgi:ribonucleotide reductase beta subunit family protein with ferritin-like domain
LNTWVNFGSASPLKVGQFSIGLNSVRLEQDKVHDLFRQALLLEEAYAHQGIPSVLGYNAQMHVKQSRFLANRRLKHLSYAPLFGKRPAQPA